MGWSGLRVLVLSGVDVLLDGRGVLPQHHLGLRMAVGLASIGGRLRIIVWGAMVLMLLVLLLLADDDSGGIISKISPRWEVWLGLGGER